MRICLRGRSLLPICHATPHAPASSSGRRSRHEPEIFLSPGTCRRDRVWVAAADTSVEGWRLVRREGDGGRFAACTLPGADSARATANGAFPLLLFLFISFLLLGDASKNFKISGPRIHFLFERRPRIYLVWPRMYLGFHWIKESVWAYKLGPFKGSMSWLGPCQVGQPAHHTRRHLLVVNANCFDSGYFSSFSRFREFLFRISFSFSFYRSPDLPVLPLYPTD
jgi:hypothetical protein